jgi:hypothetical protein
MPYAYSWVHRYLAVNSLFNRIPVKFSRESRITRRGGAPPTPFYGAMATATQAWNRAGADPASLSQALAGVAFNGNQVAGGNGAAAGQDTATKAAAPKGEPPASKDGG